MPAGEMEVGELDLAECEKQHRKNQQGLDDAYDLIGHTVGMVERRNGGVGKVTRHPCQHGYGQGVVFQQS